MPSLNPKPVDSPKVDDKAADTSKLAEKCHLCSNIFKGSTGVQCDYCDLWGHPKCMGLDQAAYNALTKCAKSAKFFCPKCLPKIDRLLTMEKRMDEMEARFKELEVKIESRLNFSTANENPFPVQTQPPSFRNTQPPPFSTSQRPPAFQAAQPGYLPPFDNLVFTQTVESVLEAQLKRHNAVLFGLPNSADDLTSVRNLMSIGSSDEYDPVTPFDIQHVFRDGPVNEDGSPRFLKVICATTKVRDAFISYINKVVKVEDPGHQNLRARPDLTYQQRVDGRNLRDKFKVFDQNTHFIDYKRKAIICKTSHSPVFSLSSSHINSY